MRELVQKIKAAAADLGRLEEGWLPSQADLRDAVILEDWMIAGDPITGQTVFWGRSIGHPILGDRMITTSPLIWIIKTLWSIHDGWPKSLRTHRARTRRSGRQ